MKILAVVSHPDDEVLGCGGTLIKHAQKKDSVCLCILGKGVASREIAENEKKIRVSDTGKDTKQAAGILGVDKIYQFDYPDNMFDSVPMLKIVKDVEKVVDSVKPDVIYTHFGKDLNIDHRITFDSVITACRPVGDRKKIRIFSFETLSSTEWQKTPFNPDYYVNISGQIDSKIKAIREYKGEIRKYPHPRSEEGIRTLAKYRGMQAGVDYAEGFEMIRSLSD
ncbi:MAG: PIG-L family deacetylase [Candidatus Aureabacteria bacterium]|nr:PIG-L family deacetylase [Candidatus Auribacterota bacterium]